ncbi:hypothetical protein [Gordonia sp. N1V]|uniref:hypothetical protein n=1 Tax=Gordonia sp. N1V TaxID=3034163 RepID=UPI0023E2F1CC|nr:hypothetical protein [Gordonia sp. N1V]MDF3280903.1 hypothetical protein [Gordonia sp. N1V]
MDDPDYRDGEALVTDRNVLRAAARDIRARMHIQQVTEQMASPDAAWSPPDQRLLDLAVECDDVAYGRRPETPDLVDRIAEILGDDWEPTDQVSSSRSNS